MGKAAKIRSVQYIVGWVERSETHQAAARLAMINYRRNFVPGASYFFTVNLANRRSRVLTARIDLLRSAFRYARARRSFVIEAVVVLPDHLHAIWSPRRGRGFCDTLAAPQVGIFAGCSTVGADFGEP
jgi:hypothetical protein